MNGPSEHKANGVPKFSEPIVVNILDKTNATHEIRCESSLVSSECKNEESGTKPSTHGTGSGQYSVGLHQQEDEFKLVTYKRPRNSGPKLAVGKPMPGNNRSTSRLAVGCARESKLSVVEKTAWIYVTRLDPSVSKEDIISHVTNMYSGDKPTILCDKLKTRHASYSSFKIGVPKRLEEECMKPSNWPSGLLIGTYFPPRKTSSMPSSDVSVAISDNVVPVSKNGKDC
jgi:hypothetical protein